MPTRIERNYVCNSTWEPLECIKIEEIRTHSGLAKSFPTHTQLISATGPSLFRPLESTRFTPLAHYANHHQSKPNIIELKRKLIKCTSKSCLFCISPSLPSSLLSFSSPPIISANPCYPLTVKYKAHWSCHCKRGPRDASRLVKAQRRQDWEREEIFIYRKSEKERDR